MNSAIESAFQAGIITVVAAGNDQVRYIYNLLIIENS